MSDQKSDLIIDPQDFPTYLKARIAIERLSLQEFAEKLGLKSAKSIYHLLNGSRPPSEAILKKLGGRTVFAFSVDQTTARAKK